MTLGCGKESVFLQPFRGFPLLFVRQLPPPPGLNDFRHFIEPLDREEEGILPVALLVDLQAKADQSLGNAVTVVYLDGENIPPVGIDGDALPFGLIYQPTTLPKGKPMNARYVRGVLFLLTVALAGLPHKVVRPT